MAEGRNSPPMSGRMKGRGAQTKVLANYRINRYLKRTEGINNRLVCRSWKRILTGEVGKTRGEGQKSRNNSLE